MSGIKIINVADTKQALAKSQPMFKPKSARLLSQDWFPWRDKPQALPPIHPWTSNGSEGVKTIWQPPYSSNFTTANLFLLESWQDPRCTRADSRQAKGGGCPNYQQKRGCRCLSVVDGPLQKVFPNQP
jgi:hypothetical protein